MTAKDVALAIIGRIGTAGGTGYAIEFAGSAIRGLSMEGRMTLCNMAIEAGARLGLVAVDEVTIDYLRGRPFAPQGEQWERAVVAWRRLHSDPDAHFDCVVELSAADIRPQVTWGTSPEMVVPVDACVPDPAAVSRIRRGAKGCSVPLKYMGLECQPADSARSRLDKIFIGSCTNSRIEDLRARRRRRQGPEGGRQSSGWRWSFRGRGWSSSRPKARDWTRFSSLPASSGASRAVRCVWR